MTPLASVMIPTYNYGRYVAEAVDSVLSQDFPIEQLQLIVADDGSTDETPSVLERYRGRLEHLRLEHRGKAAATRAAIAAARGKYLFNLDADDLFLPQKLRKVVDAFESDPAIAMVTHPMVHLFLDGGRRFTPAVPAAIKGKMRGADYLSHCFRRLGGPWGGNGPTFAARSDVVRSIPIDDGAGVVVDHLLRVFAAARGDVVVLEEALCVARFHDDSNSAGEYSTAKIAGYARARQVVFEQILSGDFPRDVKVLTGLQSKVYGLILKEALGTKSWSDVAEVWRYALAHAGLLGLDLLPVVSKYLLLEKSVPTAVKSALRRLRPSSAG